MKRNPTLARLTAFTLTLSLTLAALTGCTLTNPPTPTPTQPPPAVLQFPVLGLNPVSGAPGTVINVAAAGFQTGTKVNLYLSSIDAPTPQPIAQSLTIGNGGLLSFALSLPAQINGINLTNNANLIFTVSTVDNTQRASAIFVALIGNATAQATTVPSSGNTGTGGTGASNLYITSPGINTTVSGGSVVVTGSGSALNNRVGVQIQDANYTVLGSATAVIQAGAGAIGPWEVALGFPQPANSGPGYIVAFTVNAQGAVAQQASIPIFFAGAAAPTTAPLAPTVIPTIPTVVPVITAVPGGGSFITATP